MGYVRKWVLIVTQEKGFLALMAWVGDLASRGEACTEDIWIILKTPMSLYFGPHLLGVQT